MSVVKSIQFNGTTQFIDLGNVNPIERTTPFSLSVWFKSSSSTTQSIFAKQASSTAYTGYNIQLYSTGRIEVHLVSDAGTSDMILTYTTATGFNDGAWKHLVVTFDGSSLATGVRVYVGGANQLLTPAVNNLTASILTAANLNIGRREADGGSMYFNGNLCQMSFYDVVLTSTQVTSLYNEGNPLSERMLRAVQQPTIYMPLGDGDTYPDALENAQVVNVPVVAAGGGNTYLRIPNEVTSAEWLTGENVAEYYPLYVGPGGSCQVATRLTESAFYRGGYILPFTENDPWTAACWVKYSYTATKFGSLITKASGYDGAGIQFLQTVYGSPGDFRVRFRTQTQITEAKTVGLGLNDNNWHHVLATYNGSRLASGIHIWVDGVDQSLTVPYPGPVTSVPNYSLNISGDVDAGGAQSFDGVVAQPIIYDRVLNGTEVSELYNSGVPIDPKGLATWSDAVGFWNMGNLTGDVLRDGTYVSMNSSRTSFDTPGGVITKSLSCNGTSGYVNFGDVLNVQYTNARTISGWFKTSATGVQQPIVSKLDATFRGYYVGIGTGDGLVFNLSNTTTDRLQVTTTATWTDGAWHFFSISYDASKVAAGVTIWVDGALQATSTDFDALVNTTVDTSSLRFGSDEYSSTYFNGQIAGISMHSREFVLAQHQELYNSGTPIDPETASTVSTLIGYWEPGVGYYPGTMTNMSSANLVDDAPATSDLTTEKSWTTVDYTTGPGTQTLNAQLLVLDMKNRLASIGYTVVGSGNSTVYEWAGDTGGGSYGGESTGPYDVWASSADIVFATANPASVSWCVLQGPVTPSGQFWIVISCYSTNSQYLRMYIANSNPTLPATPLTDYPRASTDEWFWLIANEQFWDYPGNSTIPQRVYFSGATDGSFLFGRTRVGTADWDALQMFHVLPDDPENQPDDFPMKCVTYGHFWTILDYNFMQKFRCYLPGRGNTWASAVEPLTGVSTLLLNYGEDAVSGETIAEPLYLVASGQTNFYTQRSGSLVTLGYVPDMFLCSRGLARGSMAPAVAPYAFTCAEGYFWIPGDTEPSF